ncbi:MAG: HEAT repeat domain-containing protein [Planctomycetes bacterium]|nr:HEAT repeat domain-containing protein [Planctomycetota bacterium]
MTRFHRTAVAVLAVLAALSLPAAAALAATAAKGVPAEADINSTYGNAQARKDLEKSLMEVLTGGGPRDDKEQACRRLWIIGTADSVPALAALLSDKDLSHMARYALEGMPCPEAGKALRDALGTTAGRAKVGIINSLGVREDKDAVAVVAPLVKDADLEVAAAAIAALGRIGTPDAAKTLADCRATAPKELLPVVADASIKAAERLGRLGDQQAAAIYQDLDSPKWPAHVRMAGFIGLVTASPADATSRLMQALGGSDAATRQQAAQFVAAIPGAEATKTFADGLAKLPPDGQKALLRALGARKDPAARPAILAAAKSDDKGVQAAAVTALGTTGTAADVPLLAGLAASADAEVAKAAQTGLALLPGDGADEAIVAAIGSAAAPIKVQLIAALGARGPVRPPVLGGDAKCVPAVVQGLDDADAKVREASLKALAVLGGKGEVAAAVKALKAAKEPSERSAAEEALSAMSSRAKGDALPAILAGMGGADASAKGVLMRALGRIGGDKALEAVLAAAKDPDDAVKDDAARVLSDWPDASAAPHLLALAKTAAKTSHQVLGLRGYVRLAGLEQSADAKARMLSEALDLAKRPEEQRLVVGAWGTVNTVQAFDVVAKFLDDPKVAGEAATAAVAIGDKIAGKHKAAVSAAMKKIIDQTKNDRVKRDAQNVLGKAK